MPDGSQFLRVEGVFKRFGDFVALRDIELDVACGEFVCFLGPSGCGKTTLLRAIAGLDLPDAGRIEIGGCDVTFAPPAERDFGIVFQSYALFPNLTVADNVGYGLINRRMRRREIAARVDELLTLVGLSDQSAKYPVQLSGGQQQRVALARALATSPGLLLLDEPLSALDARVRARLRGEIRSLQRRLGVTTIMVTHDQEEALTMADRIVVMNAGAIEQIGTPDEVYRRPASPFVADFVGQMNFLPGQVVALGRVEIAGIVLMSDVAEGHTIGARIEVGFRPEEVRVRDLVAGTANQLEVAVDAIEFLGSFCRVRLSPVGGEASFFADFSTNVMRDLGISAGARMPVVLPPEILRAFPASRPAAAAA